MRFERISLLKAAIAAIALTCTLPLGAQSFGPIVTGKVHFNSPVSWKTNVLPAGDYSIIYDVRTTRGLITVKSLTTKRTVMLLGNAADWTSNDRSYVSLQAAGEISAVTGVYLRDAGISFTFPAPRSNQSALANRHTAKQHIPLSAGR